MFAGIGLFFLVLPEGVGPSLDRSVFSWIETPAGEVLGNLAYLVALSLIEPLYVASGFTLYLNRRTELEGWDIEIAFRQLAARRASAREAASCGPACPTRRSRPRAGAHDRAHHGGGPLPRLIATPPC
jgi:hypothetical protein